MKKPARNFLRSFFLKIVSWLGSEIRDANTGEKLGRALLIPWRGRIIILGTGLTLVPQFYPQPRLTYWKSELGFVRHPEPDFPHESRS
jgi:hypothetical protein